MKYKLPKTLVLNGTCLAFTQKFKICGRKTTHAFMALGDKWEGVCGIHAREHGASALPLPKSRR